MIDLQVIEIRDILEVKRIETVHDMVPQTILVRGKDMRNAHEVWINEIKSPSVVVTTATTLLAQVPDGAGMLRSVVVVSHRLTNEGRSRITFRLGDTTHAVSGITRLVQNFIKLLLQSPGSDAWNPTLGGGLLRVPGRLSSSQLNNNSMVADVQIGVERTAQQLMKIQASEPQLSTTERLLYARLLEAKFVPQEQALFCVIDVANQAMQSSVVNLET